MCAEKEEVLSHRSYSLMRNPSPRGHLKSRYLRQGKIQLENQESSPAKLEARARQVLTRFGLDDGKLLELLGVNREERGRIDSKAKNPEMFCERSW